MPAARFRYGPLETVGCKGGGAWYFFGFFAESVSVDALPFVRKGTMAADEGANGSLRSNRGLGCRKNIFVEKCSHA